ncbi:MAG: chemotaxis protein CheW [Deltaproteobacteria bacterium]|nr:chemotaxis protein CheW [Deltaproteobacteria bacterium]
MNETCEKDQYSRSVGQTDKMRILRERALALAKRPESSDLESQSIEVLEFSLGDERYAVGSETVREVCPTKQITSVPCSPNFVVGIINLRGQIFSVLDLKRLFDLPQTGNLEHGKVIIVGIDDMEVGILVDDVLGVKKVPVSEIQQDLPTLSGINEKYLYGLTAERLIILNMENFLTDESIVVHETLGL